MQFLEGCGPGREFCGAVVWMMRMNVMNALFLNLNKANKNKSKPQYQYRISENRKRVKQCTNMNSKHEDTVRKMFTFRK